MPLATPVLEAEGLFRRHGLVWALRGLSLRVEPGSSLLVAGHNGSGKSTLLRILAGALRPDRGRVLLNGQVDRALLRHCTALLSHESQLYLPLSAIQNLAIVARFLGRPASRDALLPALERVGLAARADSPVSAFSAGMRKRLAIARLLLQEPRIALLDEPYGELDPQGFDLLDSILDSLRERGVTVVLASHLVERSSARCDRAILLDHGRLAWSGPARAMPSRGRDLASAPLPEAV